MTDPSAPLDPGNGFLMRQGYTIAWCGWQHDVPLVDGLMSIKIPDATGPISGKIAVGFQPNAALQVQLLSDRMHRPYPVTDLKDPEATLTVADDEDAAPGLVQRDQWSFARLDGDRVVPDASHIYLASGFMPGKLYEVVYTTTGAPVVGLGLLATRDMVSFLRYAKASEDNPCARDIQYAYAFGASQSGRFLRQLLYLGLNEDEAEHMVFDGLIPHIAGGCRGEFNQRFGQPSSMRRRSIGCLFPFADTVQTDPETGRTDGLLSRLETRAGRPRSSSPTPPPSIGGAMPRWSTSTLTGPGTSRRVTQCESITSPAPSTGAGSSPSPTPTLWTAPGGNSPSTAWTTRPCCGPL